MRDRKKGASIVREIREKCDRCSSFLTDKYGVVGSVASFETGTQIQKWFQQGDKPWIRKMGADFLLFMTCCHLSYIFLQKC